MPEAHIPFSHIVVALTQYCNGVGTAYSIGSLQECRKWVLLHGMRASTAIVPM